MCVLKPAAIYPCGTHYTVKFFEANLPNLMRWGFLVKLRISTLTWYSLPCSMSLNTTWGGLI